MQNLTGYHELACQLSTELVNHGWGKMTIEVVSLKDNSVKVELSCGKSFVFFIKKQIDFDTNTIL